MVERTVLRAEPVKQLESDPKVSMSISAVDIKVLGGTFQVQELMLQPDESSEHVMTILSNTPADRWFVMVADSGAEDADSLAMIDDNLEFQIYAHGVLRQD